MSSKTLRASVLVLLAALGCGSDPATQVLVEIDAADDVKACLVRAPSTRSLDPRRRLRERVGARRRHDPGRPRRLATDPRHRPARR
ncbi:MAG: hypothetical protein H6720_15780 [Sandaracinus sp.]|nr:hypothetical protein [Sandaracinus sp.]